MSRRDSEHNFALTCDKGKDGEVDRGRNDDVRDLVPLKAYENTEWLHGRSARLVRILCEFLEVNDRLREHSVLSTMVFFGSSRLLSSQAWEQAHKLQTTIAAGTDPEAAAQATLALARLAKLKWGCFWADRMGELVTLLCEWLQTAEGRQTVVSVLEQHTPAGFDGDNLHWKRDLQAALDPESPCPVGICTGGGPGTMEAVNMAAARAPGGRSVGMAVTFPHEPTSNSYLSPGLSFRFHYFFTRKFWLLYSALAIVAAPGGFGTMDELFECLTLRQSGKFSGGLPVIFFGKSWWEKVINFEALVESGVIAEADIGEGCLFTDCPHEAFNYIVKTLKDSELLQRKKKRPGQSRTASSAVIM